MCDTHACQLYLYSRPVFMGVYRRRIYDRRIYIRLIYSRRIYSRRIYSRPLAAGYTTPTI